MLSNNSNADNELFMSISLLVSYKSMVTQRVTN